MNTTTETMRLSQRVNFGQIFCAGAQEQPKSSCKWNREKCNGGQQNWQVQCEQVHVHRKKKQCGVCNNNKKRSKLFNLALWYFYTWTKLYPSYTSIRHEQWPQWTPHKTMWCSQLYFLYEDRNRYLLWKVPVCSVQNPRWEAEGIMNRYWMWRWAT